MKPISPGALNKTAEFCRQSYFLEAAAGSSLADYLSPNAWQHNLKLKRHDLIEIVEANGDWEALLRVETTGTGFVKMRCIREWRTEELANSPEPMPDEQSGKLTAASVKFNPATGWRAFDASGAEISRGHKTKAEAEAALATRKEAA